MANIIRTFTWPLNIANEHNYKQEDVKDDISRWINDSVNFFSGKGHFGNPISNLKLTSGNRIKIDNTYYLIGQVLNKGSNLGDVYIYKDNPSLGKINSIYGTVFDNVGVDLSYLNYNSSYTGPSFLPDLYGSGKDGDLIISSLNYNVNQYTYLIGNFSNTGNYIKVQATYGFNIGDEVLLFQTQHENSSLSGNFEFHKIKDIIDNYIYFEVNLGYTFYSDKLNTPKYSRSCQLIRVPHFNNITINPNCSISPIYWNGYYGGILCFRVKNTLINNGRIDCTGRGFRGGLYSTGEGKNGDRYYSDEKSDSGLGGGGGWEADFACPGGGGSLVTSGGGGHFYTHSYYLTYQRDTSPGNISFSINSDKFCLGCGGGGSINNIGGRGSGSAIICSNILKNNGNIYLNGQTPSGWGGSGSGGVLLLYSESLYQYGLIECIGGTSKYTEWLPSGNKYSGYGGNGGIILYHTKQYTNSHTNYNYGDIYTPHIISELIKIGRLPLTLTVPSGNYYSIISEHSLDITSIQKIDKIKINYSSMSHGGDSIKIIISFDNKKTWISWYNDSWNIIDENDIESLGIEVLLLDTLNSIHYLTLNGYNRNSHIIDFKICIRSGTKFNSPKISSIDVIGSERSWRPFNIRVPRKILNVNIGSVNKFLNQS